MEQFSTTFIIGTGVFGLSLLDHITKARPSDKAVAFDSGEKESAVNDTHKITRPLYPSKRRTEIATENHEAWKAVREHYAPIGRLEITDDISKLDAIDVHLSKPRERHTKESIAKLLESPAILPRMRLVWEFAWNILNTANDPSLCCIWNEDDGVINWNPCIEEIRRPLQSMIRDKGVTRLIVGDEGWIRGLQLESGETIEISKEDQVVLTAGAWTAQLLKKSNIAAPPKGFRTVGVFTFPLKLNELHWEYIKDLPALSFQTREINCEFLPALSKEGLAKIGLTYPFTNGQNEPQNIRESPLVYYALRRVKQWAHKYYAGLKGAKVVSKEVHWDAVTEDQAPVIARHPNHGNLKIAAGGSFTHGKDLPTIGRRIDDPSEEFGWHSGTNKDKMEHNQPLLLTSDLFDDLNDAAAKNHEVRALMAQGTSHYI